MLVPAMMIHIRRDLDAQLIPVRARDSLPLSALINAVRERNRRGNRDMKDQRLTPRTADPVGGFYPPRILVRRQRLADRDAAHVRITDVKAVETSRVDITGSTVHPQRIEQGLRYGLPCENLC